MPDIRLKHLPEHIRAVLVEKDITIPILAKRMGVSLPKAYSLLRGDKIRSRSITHTVALKRAKRILGIDL